MGVWRAANNHNYMCHTFAKGFLDSNFAVIDKILNFHENCPKFHMFTKWKFYFFLKYNWNFLDQLIVQYKFYGRDMRGIYLFNFASCEPLNTRLA